MFRTRVKICGLTRASDLDQAVACGADAVGLVFCQRSKRHLEVSAARSLRSRVPPFVTAVALFQNPTQDEVQLVIDAVAPDLLQFHGEERPEFCAGFGLPYIKAIAMKGGGDPVSQARSHVAARGFLLDSHAPGAVGGTGRTFDWSRTPDLPGPLILAGGLTPANVGEAVACVRPWAVDVSSGVESAPGIKSAAKLEEFFQELARVQPR